MDVNAILNGAMNITAWIETYLINGLLGGGFNFLVEAFNAFMFFKPLIDLFSVLFGMG